MTVNVVGVVHKGSTVCSEHNRNCQVRCACGRLFTKNHAAVVYCINKGHRLSCHHCQRKVKSERAAAQASNREQANEQ